MSSGWKTVNMAILLPIAVVLAMLSLGLSASEVQPSRPYSSVLTVTNGQTFGEWTWPEMCPGKSYAVGFRLRVKTMFCVSIYRLWVWFKCLSVMESIQLCIEVTHITIWIHFMLSCVSTQVESNRYGRDDTSVNGIGVFCQIGDSRKEIQSHTGQ